MATPPNFAGLEPQRSAYEAAFAVVLPLPFERTTSYGKGTERGPAAILAASQQVETYDEELDLEPADRGIATAEPLQPRSGDLPEALAQIEAEARRHFEAGKFPVLLGGEHTLTLAAVRAARRGGKAAELGVVQFDAHADLRESYEGTPYSHASVMRRVLEEGHPILGVGIRALSAPEAALIRERDLPVVWGRELDGCESRFEAFLERLPERVYLTFDVDFLDPSLLPATGTPEPGGGAWYPTLALLRRLFERKLVVGMDAVELAPIPGQPASDFVAARLVYKCLGYRLAGRGR